MDDQPNLPFGGHAPAQQHSLTSKAAAQDIERKIGRLHRLVLVALAGGGQTDEALMNITGLGANTLRPRRRELQLMGKVRDSGKTRLVASGKSAVVWELAERGSQ